MGSLGERVQNAERPFTLVLGRTGAAAKVMAVVEVAAELRRARSPPGRAHGHTPDPASRVSRSPAVGSAGAEHAAPCRTGRYTRTAEVPTRAAGPRVAQLCRRRHAIRLRRVCSLIETLLGDVPGAPFHL